MPEIRGASGRAGVKLMALNSMFTRRMCTGAEPDPETHTCWSRRVFLPPESSRGPVVSWSRDWWAYANVLMTGISSQDSTADEQLCDTEPIKSCHDSTVTSHRIASHHISSHTPLTPGTCNLFAFVGQLRHSIRGNLQKIFPPEIKVSFLFTFKERVYCLNIFRSFK